MASTLIERAGPLCRLRHVVVDGHFGTNNVMQMVRQELALHLVSKLRHDSALYFLYEGPQKPAGRKRIYGDKINYEHIPPICRMRGWQEPICGRPIYAGLICSMQRA